MRSRYARGAVEVRSRCDRGMLEVRLRYMLVVGGKRNVRLKNVASGCDKCVWPVGVIAGCGHWVGH